MSCELKKINTPSLSTPYGARYVKVIKEHGNSVSVSYYSDENGRHSIDAMCGPGALVIAKDLYEVMVNEVVEPEKMPQISKQPGQKAQAARKLRSKDEDDEDDIRGVMKFPHSELEKEWAKATVGNQKWNVYDPVSDTKSSGIEAWQTTKGHEVEKILKSRYAEAVELDSKDTILEKKTQLNEYSVFDAFYEINKKTTAKKFFNGFNQRKNNAYNSEILRILDSHPTDDDNLGILWDFSHNNGRIVKVKDYIKAGGISGKGVNDLGVRELQGEMIIYYVSNSYLWTPSDESISLMKNMSLEELIESDKIIGSLQQIGKIGKRSFETIHYSYIYGNVARRSTPYFKLNDSFLQKLTLQKNVWDLLYDDKENDINMGIIKHMP